MSTGDRMCKHGIWFSLCAVCSGLKPEITISPELIPNSDKIYFTEKELKDVFEGLIDGDYIIDDQINAGAETLGSYSKRVKKALKIVRKKWTNLKEKKKISKSSKASSED